MNLKFQRYVKKNQFVRFQIICRRTTKFFFSQKKKTTFDDGFVSLLKESRLHRTRNVLARAGLLGVLPEEKEEIHRDEFRTKVKIKSTNFWNLSNDHHYDSTGEQDFLSKRQINGFQVN